MFAFAGTYSCVYILFLRSGSVSLCMTIFSICFRLLKEKNNNLGVQMMAQACHQISSIAKSVPTKPLTFEVSFSSPSQLSKMLLWATSYLFLFWSYITSIILFHSVLNGHDMINHYFLSINLYFYSKTTRSYHRNDKVDQQAFFAPKIWKILIEILCWSISRPVQSYCINITNSICSQIVIFFKWYMYLTMI